MHRKSQLTMFEKDMIVFPAKNEKYVVTVFTDPSCGYCRKLHQEITNYNELGITVRYLAFPRGGTQSKTFEEMQQIWCATDQKDALTMAKKGRSLKQSALNRRCDQTIQKQYELGVALGINGTPAIVLEDGRMLPGYYPAQDLLKTLSKP
jgi:thiol:disulfide interchange protein DsbC